MKKIRNLILMFTVLVTAFSCEKHVIEYDANEISGQAEFQLHYFVPLVAGTANNIYQVEINGELYANNTNPLVTYNAIPSGAVGKFFTTKVGENNIKLYKSTGLELVYDQNVTLTSGKQNIFVYDFTKPPIVIDNGYPYTSVVTENTAEVSWVKFYNFLFESDGVPTSLRLQYQGQWVVNDSTKEKSPWTNIGVPVSFGEATDWVPVHVNLSTTIITSGNDRVDYRIKLVDQSGNETGDLEILNSSGRYVIYSDWWTAFVGRRYHHVFSGMRTKAPLAAVRQFTAL